MSQTIAARRVTNPAAAVAAGDLIPMAQGGVGVVGLASELLTYVQANLTALSQNLDANGFTIGDAVIGLNGVAGDFSLVTNASGIIVEGAASSVELGYLVGVTSAIQTQLNLKALLTTNTFTGLQTITQATTNTGILASTGYSLTGSNATSLIDLAGTWNTSGTPTAFKLNVVNTASNAASLLFDWQVGGVSRMKLNADSTLTLFSGLVVSTTGTVQPGGASGGGALATSGLFLGSDRLINWSSTTAWSGSADLILARDAANTLALRNGVNAQTFNVYNTFTDASNYERLMVGANAGGVGVNNFGVIAGKAGSGTARDLYIGSGGSGGVGSLYLTTSASARWQVNASGHFLAATDNTYDIGASGATRPRNLYLAGNAQVSAGAAFEFSTRGYFLASADGVFRFTNAAAADFSRLQLGGTTSSFPSLKRSSAELHSRLADDSADASLQALSFKVATVQVLGAQRTGWSAATGGATRTTFDTATVTLPQLAERVKAWLDDALVHGLIGA